MIIKVCGMRNADNIKAVEAMNIDWMGFIFYLPSKRNVEHIPSYLPTNCMRVGVMVNASIEEVMSRQRDFSFDLIQLHGNETPDFCIELHKRLPEGVQLIKMIQISSSADLEIVKHYEGLVDYFLFETKCAGYGGSGMKFDWNILDEYYGTTPFLLTGGIGPEDIEKVKSFKHPQFVGVDLNSKFEISPAYKDIEILKKFIKQLR